MCGSEQHWQTRPLLSGLLRWVICISAGADSGFSLGWHQQCCGFDCNLVTWLAYAPYPSHLLFSSQNLHEHKSVENSNLCQMQLTWPKGSEVSSCEKRKGKTAKKEREGCTLYEHRKPGQTRTSDSACQTRGEDRNGKKLIFQSSNQNRLKLPKKAPFREHSHTKKGVCCTRIHSWADECCTASP